MGTWGPGILSNDTALDVYDSYMELYNGGASHSKIRDAIGRRFASVRNSPDEGHDYWLALAAAQWDCGVLQRDIFQRVSAIAASEKEVQLWSETAALLAKRKMALQGFLTRISKPKATPRKPRRPRKFSTAYEPGDCLAVDLGGKGFGAALVLAANNSHKIEGTNLIGLLNYKRVKEPTLDVFKKRRWLMDCGRRALYWCLARFHKKQAKRLSLVGHIPLRKNDPQQTGHCGDWDFAEVIRENYKAR